MTRNELSCVTLLNIIHTRESQSFSKKLTYLEKSIQRLRDIQTSVFATMQCTSLPKKIAIQALHCTDDASTYHQYFIDREKRILHTASVLGYTGIDDITDVYNALCVTRDTADAVVQEYVYRFLHNLVSRMLRM